MIPALLAEGGIQLAANLLPRLFGNKARQRRLDQAANTFTVPQGAKDAVNVAKGLANSGDPNLNANLQGIASDEANQAALAKRTTGNVSDILSSIQQVHKNATMATMRANAQDSAYRQSAMRNLQGAEQGLGATQFAVQQGNYGAVQNEKNRQAQQLQSWQQTGANVASDVSSASYLKKYGFPGYLPGGGGAGATAATGGIPLPPIPIG